MVYCCWRRSSCSRSDGRGRCMSDPVMLYVDNIYPSRVNRKWYIYLILHLDVHCSSWCLCPWVLVAYICPLGRCLTVVVGPRNYEPFCPSLWRAGISTTIRCPFFLPGGLPSHRPTAHKRIAGNPFPIIQCRATGDAALSACQITPLLRPPCTTIRAESPC